MPAMLTAQSPPPGARSRTTWGRAADAQRACLARAATRSNAVTLRTIAKMRSPCSATCGGALPSVLRCDAAAQRAPGPELCLSGQEASVNRNFGVVSYMASRWVQGLRSSEAAGMAVTKIPACMERAARMRSSSSATWSANIASRLFNATTGCGSM